MLPFGMLERRSLAAWVRILVLKASARAWKMTFGHGPGYPVLTRVIEGETEWD